MSPCISSVPSFLFWSCMFTNFCAHDGHQPCCQDHLTWGDASTRFAYCIDAAEMCLALVYGTLDETITCAHAVHLRSTHLRSVESARLHGCRPHCNMALRLSVPLLALEDVPLLPVGVYMKASDWSISM